MLDEFLSSFSASADILPSVLEFALYVLVSVVFGLVVGLTYMKTDKLKMPSQSFTLTLVILPALVTIIIMLVGSNVARAFSLGGAFAIIRFRSVAGDPKDIALVLFCMAIGLACGMGFLLYGLVITVVLCLVTIILHLVNFGFSKTERKLLKIQIPEDFNYKNAFNDILDKYTSVYHLTKVRTTDLGSLYEIVYTVTMSEDTDEKKMIDELRCRNGNLPISLVFEPKREEFQTL